MSSFSKTGPVIIGVLLMAACLFAEEPIGYLGIIMEDVNDSIAAQQGLKNGLSVLVADVVKESPAEKSGLLKNDVILKFDGSSVRNSEKLWKMIGHSANKSVTVEGIRASAPFSLSVAVGVKPVKLSHVTVTAFNDEAAGDQQDKEGHSREAVDHYINALEEVFGADEAMAGREGFPGLVLWDNVQDQKLVSRQVIIDMGDDNIRLRQKIITIVLRLKAPPAAPEQAERAMAIARATQAEAKDDRDYLKAISKYSEASRSAPWLAELYFNLGVLCERMGYLNVAIDNFKLYLNAAPGADDAQKVKDKIYLLEDKEKDQAAATVTAAKVKGKKSQSNWTAKDTREIVQLSIALIVVIALLIGLSSSKS